VVKENRKEQGGELVREVIDLELRDASIVTYPAYPAAGMRNAEPAAGGVHPRFSRRGCAWLPSEPAATRTPWGDGHPMS
jgi:hypothetical protein